MRRWLRRRRERSERIETEADELARLLGDDAYSEARWREHKPAPRPVPKNGI
jgi:hypothetical protein